MTDKKYTTYKATLKVHHLQSYIIIFKMVINLQLKIIKSTGGEIRKDLTRVVTGLHVDLSLLILAAWRMFATFEYLCSLA